jgi:predicted house-cleaning noncanonical NTP pyrophosphatase (MazG superfamily)
MLKVNPGKVEPLLHAERNMIASLCSRDRDALSAAISECERLIADVEKSYVEATDQLKDIEAIVSTAASLLTSAAASGIDADVAPAFVQAGMLIEHARKYLLEGNAQEAEKCADEAIERLRMNVIEPQSRVREEWSNLVLEAAALLEKAAALVSLETCYRCPDRVEALYSKLTELISGLASREPESLQVREDSLRELLDDIQASVSLEQEELHREITAELSEIEQAVKRAVEKCSGYYAPDALESVYLDIKRLWGELSGGPDALRAGAEIELRKDLAVARAKLWQVEFLRERFEKEREEDLRQLRLKMQAARSEVEACAKLDFVMEGSLLLDEARSFLDQADNSIIEGDMDGSFDLVRQTMAIIARLREESEENKQRWKQLTASLHAGDALHKAVLSDPASSQFAPDEFQNLSELAEETTEIIERKNLRLLANHIELLHSMASAVQERVKQKRFELRERAQHEIQKAQDQIALAQVLHSGRVCPDVLTAARSFDEIACTYLSEHDYDRAIEAAADAFVKASDAVMLGKAGMERAGNLAADYMKIAQNHLLQGNNKAAEEALRKGLSMALSARVKDEEEGQSAND